MQARSLHASLDVITRLFSIAPLLPIVIALAELTPGTAKLARPWTIFNDLKRRLT
jgi:hypothetical protein